MVVVAAIDCGSNSTRLLISEVNNGRLKKLFKTHKVTKTSQGLEDSGRISNDSKKQLFNEVYQLAYTQQKKNKDIPEGGSKATLLIHPYEITWDGSQSLNDSIHEKTKKMYYEACQKSFIDNLLVLVNSDQNGCLKARNIIDYSKKPEYI